LARNGLKVWRSEKTCSPLSQQIGQLLGPPRDFIGHGHNHTPKPVVGVGGERKGKAFLFGAATNNSREKESVFFITWQLPYR
jgi:hypothetical protein